MLKVQILSREMIKPSSPTPHHLRSYNLTLLDQSLPPMYVPVLFFYSPSGGNSNIVSRVEKAQKLKNSLSETLTRYYPLAGRIKEGGPSMVECNDQGVELSEARADGRLSEFLKQPYVEMLDRMVPCNLHRARSGADGVLLAVQVSLFDCGGMVIGVCIHHKIADGVSLGTFMNDWASTSHYEVRHESNTKGPDFQSSKPFPIQGPVPLFDYIRKDNVVAKRFVFDASKIEALRAGASTIDLPAGRPTRVEAVSALIWRCIMRTNGGEEGSTMGASFATHFVNLRGRMSPPLPEHTFGNIVTLATAVATERDCHEGMQGILERKLRDAIRGVDIHCIKELQKPDGMSRMHECLNSEIGKYIHSGHVDFIYFTSWCGFPFYQADFGWGKPVWVSTCTFSIKNLVVLNKTSGGDGIEVWVNMEDVDMAKFEQDQELLRFVSPASTA